MVKNFTRSGNASASVFWEMRDLNGVAPAQRRLAQVPGRCRRRVIRMRSRAPWPAPAATVGSSLKAPPSARPCRCSSGSARTPAVAIIGVVRVLRPGHVPPPARPAGGTAPRRRRRFRVPLYGAGALPPHVPGPPHPAEASPPRPVCLFSDYTPTADCTPTAPLEGLSVSSASAHSRPAPLPREGWPRSPSGPAPGHPTRRSGPGGITGLATVSRPGWPRLGGPALASPARSALASVSAAAPHFCPPET